MNTTIQQRCETLVSSCKGNLIISICYILGHTIKATRMSKYLEGINTYLRFKLLDIAYQNSHLFDFVYKNWNMYWQNACKLNNAKNGIIYYSAKEWFTDKHYIEHILIKGTSRSIPFKKEYIYTTYQMHDFKCYSFLNIPYNKFLWQNVIRHNSNLFPINQIHL